jgi:hypothetical protein
MPPDEVPPPPNAPAPASPPNPRREILRTIAINAVAPYVVYVLCEPSLGGFVALALSAIPPTLESIWSIARDRRLDIMSALVLGGIALSLVLIAFGGSERVLLLRESLVTAAIGLVLAGSAVIGRPLVFYLLRQVSAGHDNAAVARWNKRWETEATLRRSMRVMTLVWGIWLVLEMTVRTVMVFQLETATFLLISPFVQYGLTGVLVVWTIVFLRRRVFPSN